MRWAWKIVIFSTDIATSMAWLATVSWNSDDGPKEIFFFGQHDLRMARFRESDFDNLAS